MPMPEWQDGHDGHMVIIDSFPLLRTGELS